MFPGGRGRTRQYFPHLPTLSQFSRPSPEAALKVTTSKMRRAVSDKIFTKNKIFCYFIFQILDDISAVLKLDNVEVARTSWKPCSQQAWDQRFSIQLEKSRELELLIYWKDWRSLCAVKFCKLEEFVDDVRHGMALQLEPQGILFAEVINSNFYTEWQRINCCPMSVFGL